LLSDYADVSNSCLADLIDHDSSVAVFGASVRVYEDRGVRALLERLSDLNWQVLECDVVRPEVDISIAAHGDYESVFPAGVGHWASVINQGQIHGRPM
jgi:hypothetical protein